MFAIRAKVVSSFVVLLAVLVVGSSRLSHALVIEDRVFDRSDLPQILGAGENVLTIRRSTFRSSQALQINLTAMVVASLAAGTPSATVDLIIHDCTFESYSSLWIALLTATAQLSFPPTHIARINITLHNNVFTNATVVIHPLNSSTLGSTAMLWTIAVNVIGNSWTMGVRDDSVDNMQLAPTLLQPGLTDLIGYSARSRFYLPIWTAIAFGSIGGSTNLTMTDNSFHFEHVDSCIAVRFAEDAVVSLGTAWSFHRNNFTALRSGPQYVTTLMFPPSLLVQGVVDVSDNSFQINVRASGIAIRFNSVNPMGLSASIVVRHCVFDIYSTTAALFAFLEALQLDSGSKFSIAENSGHVNNRDSSMFLRIGSLTIADSFVDVSQNSVNLTVRYAGTSESRGYWLAIRDAASVTGQSTASGIAVRGNQAFVSLGSGLGHFVLFEKPTSVSGSKAAVEITNNSASVVATSWALANAVHSMVSITEGSSLSASSTLNISFNTAEISGKMPRFFGFGDIDVTTGSKLVVGSNVISRIAAFDEFATFIAGRRLWTSQNASSSIAKNIVRNITTPGVRTRSWFSVASTWRTQLQSSSWRIR